jgi:Mucin-2 protein WxxW repeating region
MGESDTNTHHLYVKSRIQQENDMKTFAARSGFALLAVALATPAIAGTTPWFDRDNPGGSGDWENLSALVTKVECTLAANGQSTVGKPGYTCDVAGGSICRNSAAVACENTQVRYSFDDLRGNKFTTPWLQRDDPSGDGDWELTSQLLKVECKFTATNAPMTTGGAYNCGSPDSRTGGNGLTAKNGGKPVDNIAVRFSF